VVARSLLGKHLVRRRPGGRVDAWRITEVEAYDGEADLACHARAGRTRRTAVLYGAAGVWYVYLCYGMHEMLNLVVGPRDWPAAVLIRGVEGISGPGRLTKTLRIDRRLNAARAARASGLWIEERDPPGPARRVRATPRIGVNYAGPVWAKKRWRFVLVDRQGGESLRRRERPTGLPGVEGTPRPTGRSQPRHLPPKLHPAPRRGG